MSLAPDRSRDIEYMRLAIAAAREAADEGEVPVGAVVTAPGLEVIVERNRTRERSDPTAHAELIAVRRAAARLGDWRLLGHTLYVTLEPCSMCAGGIILGRVPRLVFGASDPKAGMCGSLGNLLADERLNHQVEIEAGILADECGRLLKEFFRELRDGSASGRL